MITQINASQLASIYKIHPSTLQKYLLPYRAELKELGTFRKKPGKNKLAKCRFYNTEELRFIVYTIMGDLPEGWVFNEDTLKPKTNGE